MTAAELAGELEVSVATARRDLDALSAAGIPVYPQPGRGGGWSLVGSARTDLSGLSAAEAQALLRCSLSLGAGTDAGDRDQRRCWRCRTSGGSCGRFGYLVMQAPGSKRPAQARGSHCHPSRRLAGSGGMAFHASDRGVQRAAEHRAAHVL